jgi:serine/threonine-protein kinase
MPEIAIEPRPGDAVGPYRITKVIGRGRMGIVYEGTPEDGGDPVAVKVVTTELAQDAVFLKRFQREVRAAERIVHENVVPVLGHGEANGLPYLAQQLIPGGSLTERIARTGTLDLATTLPLIAGTAAGIDALHAGGLVHRDIKPANVLLDLDGKPYVSDFGLAKDSQASNLTRPGQALGSLDYMSPEQIRGDPVSAATDVYSLGCLVHECLTGTPPFGGRPSMRVLFAHLQEEPADLSASLPGISEGVARAINRAMEKEPDQRPASATAYVRAIATAAGISL